MDESLKHLGNVLHMFAELDINDRPKAFNNAMEYYNFKCPNNRVEPISGYKLFLLYESPLDLIMEKDAL